jgi:signal recognition particle receptor subunit beta
MKVICAKYKSQAVEYMKENELAPEDVVVVCNESDSQSIRGAEVDEVVELEPRSLLYSVDEVKAAVKVKEISAPPPAPPKMKEKPEAEKKEEPKTKK